MRYTFADLVSISATSVSTISLLWHSILAPLWTRAHLPLVKAVLDLPASLLRKARAAARKRGMTIAKLAARGFRLAIEEPPNPPRPRKLTQAQCAALEAREDAITEEFRAFPRVDTRPVAEVVSSMRR